MAALLKTRPARTCLEKAVRTILLTGATGFVGAHMARSLVDRCHLRLYVRRCTPLIHELRYRGAAVTMGTGAGDVPMLRKAIDRADTVIHCAGATKALNRQAFYEANVAFTERILSMMGPQQRFILISSQAAVGPSPRGMSIDETARPAPVTGYGRSKQAAERITRAWGRENDRNYLVLRPSAVYGPGERDFFLLFKGIRMGVACLPGNGRQRLSLLHVDDLVRATVAALERGPRGETYFVTGDQPASWLELSWLIQAALARDRVVRLRCPAAMALPAAFFADALSMVTGKPGIVCRDKVMEMRQKAWLCSNRKIKEHLSWRPIVSLKDGVEQTAAWYMKNRPRRV